MAITVVTPADHQLLTTIAAVKSELRLDPSDETEDVYILQKIKEASDFIRSYCGRVFGEERVIETIGAIGAPEILLERTPITTIHEVLDDGTTVPATDYSISNADAGIVFKESGWRNSHFEWDPVAPQESPYQNPTWSFEYTAGYILPGTVNRNLPFDLESVCIDIAKTGFRSKGFDTSIKRYRVGQTDVSWFGGSGSGGGNTGLSPRMEGILNFHRRAF